MKAILCRLCVAVVATMIGRELSVAQQAEYPTKPIRFMVPFPAGGGADIIARLVGQKMTETLGQPLIVDNRPGAAGVIGTDIVAKAAPDGYRILLLSSNLAILEGAGGQRPYDLRKDLQAVVQVAVAPNILVVNSAVLATSVQQLIAYAKSQPGKLHFPSNGVGCAMSASRDRKMRENRQDGRHQVRIGRRS